MRRRLSFIKSLIANNKILLVVLLFSVASINLYREFMPDDAFIHIGYAKDIAEGKGYSFAGNKTYGSTSPLWPLLIAAISFAHIDFENAARILSFIFSVAAILLMYTVSRLRFSVFVSLSAACIFSFNAYFLRWSFTGMEATAASFFMLLLIYILFQERRGQVKNFWYLLIGVSPLIRPEFFVFLPIYFVYFFLSKSKLECTTKLLLTFIPSVMWNSYAFAYFGTIVPTTFSIKAAGGLFSTEWDTIMRSCKLIISGNPLEFCAIIITTVLLVVNRKKTYQKQSSSLFLSEFIVFAFWITLFYLYYILKNVTILSRYSLVLLSPIILMTLYLVMRVCQQYKLSPRTTNLLLVLFTAISTLGHSFFTVLIVKPDADSFVQGFQREYKKIASILSVEGHGQGSVALSDVGIIGFYSGLKIDDFVGLVDKERLHFSNNKSYFMNKKPQYIISRGEINVEELKDSMVSFHEIYSTQITGLGINQKGDVKVDVYEVHWSQ